MTAATSGASLSSAPAKDNKVVRLADLSTPQRALVRALLAAAARAAEQRAQAAA